MGSIFYPVPLIPQCGVNTCWYACLQMIVRHERTRRNNQSIGADIDQPGINAQICQRNQALNVIMGGVILQIATMANLRVHRLSNSIGNLEQLLTAHGPLFYAGRAQGWQSGPTQGHCVVICGVNTDTDQVHVNDPAPTGVGSQISVTSGSLFAQLLRSPDLPLLSC